MTAWMKRAALAAAAGAAALTTASCATYAPCTDAWYAYETREAFAPVRHDARRTLNQLRDASASLDQPSVMTAVRLAFALESLTRVFESIDRESLPRLRAAADACDDPAFVRRAFFDFLDQEGIAELAAMYDGLDVMLDDGA